MFVQAIKRGHDMGVCMCVITKQISSTQVLVWVSWKPSWKCYKRSTPRCVCVCAHVKPRVGTGVCTCVCLWSSLSRLQLLVCVCMYMHANTAERLRLHKAVMLLLIMKYFVLKIVSYSQITTSCTLFSSPHKKSLTGDTPTNCVSNSKRWFVT